MIFPGYRPVGAIKNSTKCACPCACSNPHDDVRWKRTYVCTSCWTELNAQWPDNALFPKPRHA